MKPSSNCGRRISVRLVAHAYAHNAIFMPKPVKEDNGSGTRTRISIRKGGKPL